MRFAAVAGSDCTSGSGVTRRDRRSCSFTAGRNPSCAGRGRSHAGRGLPDRHLRPARPRHVGEAAGAPRIYPRRATVGRGPQRRHRAAPPRPALRWSPGPRCCGHRLPARVRQEGICRRQPVAARSAAVHPRSTTSGPACSRTPGDAGYRTCRRIAAIQRFLRACTAQTAQRRALELRHCAGTWSFQPRSGGALFAREIDADDVLSRLSSRASSPMAEPTGSCCPR